MENKNFSETNYPILYEVSWHPGAGKLKITVNVKFEKFFNQNIVEILDFKKLKTILTPLEIIQ